MEPNLPKGSSFLVIHYGQDYCLLESGPDLEAERFPEDLTLLLHSCHDYPPARALAMEDMARLEPSRGDAFDAFRGFLKAHLDAQPTAGYLLLCAVKDQPGYCRAGAYYWVLGFKGRDTVRWVSRDYQIYPDHVSLFAADEEGLRRHFPERRSSRPDW